MKLIVIGAGGHAKVVVDTANASGWDVIGFCDDNPNAKFVDLPFLGVPNEVKFSFDIHVVIAIGQNTIRQKIANELADRVTWATIIHPRATVSSKAKVQEGTVIFAGAVVQADAVLGKHNIINTNASIDHDCTIKDYCHIAPGAVLVGGVQLDTGVFVGAGAVILPKRRIGEWTTIGAGAVALNDLEAHGVFVGVPAFRLHS